jgi:MFS family permease
MFIGGRFLIGLGISFTCVAGPSLLFELAHPDMRGTITSSVSCSSMTCSNFTD